MQCYKKDQEMSRLNHNDPLNKWTLVLTETLPDSRGKVESIFIGPIIFGSTIKPSQRCSNLIDVALCDGDGKGVSAITRYSPTGGVGAGFPRG